MTAWPTQQHLVTRCAHCAWTHTGTLEQGVEASRAHRLKAHGIDIVPRKRKGRSPWSSHTPLADNIANARTQGAARWYDQQEER